MNWEDDKRVRRAGTPLSTTVDGEEVILHLETDTYFGVDGAGIVVWEHLTDEPTVAELVDAVQSEYDIGRERAAEDVRSFLTELRESDLVEPVDEQ